MKLKTKAGLQWLLRRTTANRTRLPIIAWTIKAITPHPASAAIHAAIAPQTLAIIFALLSIQNLRSFSNNL